LPNGQSPPSPSQTLEGIVLKPIGQSSPFPPKPLEETVQHFRE
jgi:hypothetical protein